MCNQDGCYVRGVYVWQVIVRFGNQSCICPAVRMHYPRVRVNFSPILRVPPSGSPSRVGSGVTSISSDGV
jgi:hypothetical protein